MSSHPSSLGVEARSGAVCRALESCLPHYDTIIARRPSKTDALEQLNVIDAEIRAVDTSVALLRRRRNALSPSSRLYPEILAHILGYLRELSPFNKSYIKGTGLVLDIGWVMATHVCSYWRTVAMQNSWLWSRITFCLGERWVTEFLRRASVGRLDLSYASRYQSSRVETVVNERPGVFNRILEDAGDRIQSLTVVGSFKLDETYPALYPTFMSTPNACIDTLVLRSVSSSTPPSTGLTWPKHLFAGNAPNLRSLEVYQGFSELFTFISPVLAHLSSLTLTANCTKTTYRELHDLLSHASRLQHLMVTDHEWPLGEDAANSFGPINFPSLKTYHMEGPLAESISLFHLVRVPITCSVTIACGLKRRDNFAIEVPRLAKVITRQDGPFTGIKTLELASRRVPKKCYMISGWRHDSSTILMDDFTEDGHPRAETRISPDCSIMFQQPPNPGLKLDTYAPEFMSLFPLLPLGGVVNLSFRSSALRYNFSDWPYLRRACVALRWLRLDKNIAMNFVPKSRYGTGETPYNAPASVRELVLANADDYHNGKLDTGALEDALQSRGRAALASVVTDLYNMRDLDQKFPTLKFQRVRRVYRGDAEDKNQ
ncbi:unnamed protein product [Peniophora sp. CBMAI 1063]|nr:unnamed protein product [Peniophora sp. CBMAI 1063]